MVFIPIPGSFGYSPFGIEPFGSSPASFRVLSALSVSNTDVIVTFSETVDFLDPTVLSPANYTILGLTVLAVTQVSDSGVQLQTTPQSFSLYEVQVTSAFNMVGQHLDPLHASAFFTGWPTTAAYKALATSPTRVRLVFSEPMLINPALTDPLSYQVMDLSGAIVLVTAVTVEQSIHPESVILTLSAPLRTTAWYQTTVLAGVQTESLLGIVPGVQIFQWVEQLKHFSIPIGAFTGEAFGGLLGAHAGLVFFSPALEASAANSVIQVDSVDVCSKAYDEYHFPVPVDPPPLYTWGTGITPGLLGSGFVLWGRFPRLTEFTFDLSARYTEATQPPPVDGPATATLRETWDPTFVALLNVPEYQLYYNVGTGVPPTFICANNAAPIPPGPVTVIVL